MIFDSVVFCCISGCVNLWVGQEEYDKKHEPVIKTTFYKNMGDDFQNTVFNR